MTRCTVAVAVVLVLPPRQRAVMPVSAAPWQGRRAEALRLADALGQRYPDDADAAYVRGDIHVHFGMTVGHSPPRARESLQRAIRLDPDLLDAYIHVIEVHCLAGDTTEAWNLLDRALAMAPQSVVFRALEIAMLAAVRRVYRGDAEELRGRIAEQRGDTVAAVRAYRNVVGLWKDADPEVQPRVAAARAAVARLEHAP